VTGDGSPRPFTRLPGGLAPLGYRNFALYWAGLTATNTGKWIEQTGAVWLAYELSGDPLLLGLLGLARGIPTVILTPFAGVIADRVDQRRLVFATQGLAGLLSLALGILILAGRVELWHLYLQVLLQSTILALDTTARQALFPRLVPRAHIVESVTLVSAAVRSSGLVGPAIGGLAIAALGDAFPFLLNAATFLFLMGALLWMRGVTRTGAVAGSFLGDLSEGFRYMLAAPVMNGLLKLEIVFALFQVNPVIITIVARDVLGVGPEGFGALLSALAGGALLGTGVLIAVGSGDRPGRFVTVATLAYATAMIAFALGRSYVVAFGALIVIGVFDACVSIIRNSIMQLAAPGRMRGRVMANQGTIVRGVGPLAQTQSGAMAGAFGGPVAVVVAAAVMGLAAAVVARANRALWTFSSRDAAAAGDPDSPVAAGDPETRSSKRA
jgi:MFS family permease